MKWLIDQLTPIGRIRRNVVLLGALAVVLSYFSVQTSDVAFLGARFSNDTLYFALFHLLSFYVAVLAYRLAVHAYIGSMDLRSFADSQTDDHWDRVDRRAGAQEPLASLQDRFETRRSFERRLRGLWIWLIIIGEYGFALLLGALGAISLLLTKDFPMVWELSING